MVSLTDIIVFIILVNIVVGFVMAFVLPTIYTLLNRSRLRQIMKRKTVVIEYEAPLGLSPAAIGYLDAGKLTERELLATVLYLEQQKAVTRKTIDGVVVFMPVDNSTYASDSPSVNRALRYAGLQPRVDDHEVAMAFLDDFEAATHQELVALGLLRPKRYMSGRGLLSYFVTYMLISLAIIISANTRLRFSQDLFTSALYSLVWIELTLPLLVGTFLVYAAYIQFRLFGLVAYTTEAFNDVWPHIEGYKRYIEQAELDQISFENRTNPRLSKDELLPYSIALGLKSGWDRWFQQKH